MSETARVLVVETDARARERLSEVVAAFGFDVDVAADCSEALSLASSAPWDACIVSATRATAKDSADLLASTRKVPGLEGLAFVVLSPIGDAVTRATMLAAQPDALLSVPTETAPLRAALERLVSQQRSRMQIDRQRAEHDAARARDEETGALSLAEVLEKLRREFASARTHRDPLACCRVSLASAVEPAAAATLLREALRETDWLGRIHGSEFLVLLPKTHLPGALVVSERIVHNVSALAVEASGPAIGVAIYPSREVRSLAELLRATEVALETALGRQGKRVCVAGRGGD